MALALTLGQKIISLFLILGVGVLLVKTHLIKSEGSKVLSVLSVNLIMPCSIIASYQVDNVPEVRQGLALAFAAAIVVHIVFLLVNIPLKKIFKLDAVERVSVLYPNAGNLIIPLVTAMFGKEWVIYSSAFTTVQRFLIWTHGLSALKGETKVNLRKLFLNINLMTVVLGLAMFLLGIKIPDIVESSIESVGNMIGPISMLIMGMLIGGMRFRDIAEFKRVWIVAGIRLIVMPLIMLPFYKLACSTIHSANIDTIMMISYMATMSASAAMVTQLAVLNGCDAEYASAINVVTTVGTVITMPLMMALF